MACGLAAHEIPSDITIQEFFKPEGNRARLLIRVPMAAMRDVEFPEWAPGSQGPNYLDFDHSEQVFRDAAKEWIAGLIQVYEGARRLPEPSIVEVRASLASDRSFATYEQALAHLMGPKLTNATAVVWNQTLLDVLLEYPIDSERSDFSIRSSLDTLGLRVVTALRFLPPAGGSAQPIRAFEFTGDPGMLRLDPHWYQAAARFVRGGFEHILTGADHLLFLFCLVIPFRRFRSLIPIITAFTAAHSITLIASAYNLAPEGLWFPPLIETLIAASIVYMALENIVGKANVHRRWMIAFGFGLVHGFGFSFGLKQTLQFAGSHLLTSLLSFNAGVELGQLLVLCLFVPVLELLFRFVVEERMGTIILSAFVAHTGWHWMLDRGATLARFPFAWPQFDPAIAVVILRWSIAIVVLAGCLWFLHDFMRRRGVRERPAPEQELTGR